MKREIEITFLDDKPVFDWRDYTEQKPRPNLKPTPREVAIAGILGLLMFFGGFGMLLAAMLFL